MQAYDYRMKMWQKLPSTKQSYKAGSCCVHQGKIYFAAPFDKNQIVIEVFDPVAGRWAISGKVPPGIRFEGDYLDIKIWLVSTGTELGLISYGKKGSVHKICEGLQEWECMPSFENAFAKYGTLAEICDTFVF